MQTNNLGTHTIFEMTPYGITNLLVQVFNSIRLGKDRSPQGARN